MAATYEVGVRDLQPGDEIVSYPSGASAWAGRVVEGTEVTGFGLDARVNVRMEDGGTIVFGAPESIRNGEPCFDGQQKLIVKR